MVADPKPTKTHGPQLIDEHATVDSGDDSVVDSSVDSENLESALADISANSQKFVGSWNRVVSTTNWEKGRIINEWRVAMQTTHAQIRDYGDEAWSRLVGGITPQHVGRLRRVFDRFGSMQNKYAGLYWSHFQAALDWEDAELWLEGAVQNRWSVSEMRRVRWETMGALEAHRPEDADIVSTEFAEESAVFADAAESPALVRADGFATDFPPDGSSDTDNGRSSIDLPSGEIGLPIHSNSQDGQSVPPSQPFKDLPALPEDLAEAFESLKLAVLRHKSGGWTEISLQDLLLCLDALKDLARVESE